MARTRNRRGQRESGSLWDRPQLLNLIADALLVLGTAGLAYAAVMLALRLPVFPLREMTVLAPLQQVTEEQLEYAARSSLTGNFFTVDLDQVRASFEKLPWVRHAEVRRRWPSALELEIEEHRAAAYWRQGESGDTRLVNEHGEVFAAASDATLPVLSGPEGSSALVLWRYQEFTGQLKALGQRPVAVSLSARQAWQLKLDDGLVIELGRDRPRAPVTERLARFVAVYGEAQARIGRPTLVADLRYPNGFALKTARAKGPDNKGKS